MGFVETITITDISFASVNAIQEGPVSLGFSAFAILSVFLLVVSLFDFHVVNIINCWGGGT